ncbi:MAG: esterase/lipase family protein [Gemmatimonadaceae bacterium]
MNYGGTVFVHGLVDSPSRWTNPLNGGASPFDRYNAVVDVGPPTFPALSGAASIATQRGQLTSVLNAAGGPRVVVGHSMGGLIARSSAINGASNVAAIITVATPHQGSYAANNAAKLHGFINKSIDRSSSVASTIGYRFLGPIAGSILNQYMNTHFWIPARNELQLRLPDPASAAVNDLKVGSSAINTLNANTSDAVLPRANIVGHVPVTNFPLRLVASSTGRDFNDMNQKRKWAMSALKACKHVGYLTIVHHYIGRKCSLAYKHFARLDGRFLLWTNGAGPGNRPRNVPFDGIVAAERANYPGFSPAQNIISNTPTSDHFGVLGDANRVRDGMSSIGMRLR